MIDEAEPIVDITRDLVVTIDEADRIAHQCDPWECVIANALNRLPGISGAQIGAQFVRFLKDGFVVRGELAHDARMMVRAYDLHNQPIPAGIHIKIIPPARKLGEGRPTSRVPRDQQRKTGRTQRIRRGQEPSTRNIFVKPPTNGHA